MSEYRYNVDTTVTFGNCTTITSFGFDTVGAALRSFNEAIELRRRSHTEGQVWSVTLYDMELCDIRASISSTDFNLE